jgi:hypothetical protein
MATVRDFVRNDLPPQSHAYDDPDLSPIEFLLAVMRDTSLPLPIRISAASAVAPYQHPRSRQDIVPYHCKIIIGGLPPPEPGAGADPTGFHSQDLRSASINVTHGDEAVNLVNIETTSSPPSLAEIEEIKAAVHALRPDLAHLPIPEPRLCACGHWMFGPCPLGEQCRERSSTKLN